jgi:hypothetical protein
MAILDFTTAQGSQEWYSKRHGIPTASCADLVLTPKRLELASGRKKYAARLIAERLLNYQTDSLDKIDHVLAGKKGEPFAVGQLEEVYEIETKPIGFILTSDRRFGASPDRVSGINKEQTRVDTVVECKVPTIVTQMERLIFGHDDAYILQVQMQLWVAEADKAIFFSWSDRMPAYKVDSGRNEPVIRKLVEALNIFDEELDIWTEKVKRMGAFQAFPNVSTPLDAELGQEMRKSGLADVADAIDDTWRNDPRYQPPSEANLNKIIDDGYDWGTA